MTSLLASEFHKLQEVLVEHENKDNKDTRALLAHLCDAHMLADLGVNSYLPKSRIHFAHFEDLIIKPRKTAERLF